MSSSASCVQRRMTVGSSQRSMVASIVLVVCRCNARISACPSGLAGGGADGRSSSAAVSSQVRQVSRAVSSASATTWVTPGPGTARAPTLSLALRSLRRVGGRGETAGVEAIRVAPQDKDVPPIIHPPRYDRGRYPLNAAGRESRFLYIACRERGAGAGIGLGERHQPGLLRMPASSTARTPHCSGSDTSSSGHSAGSRASADFGTAWTGPPPRFTPSSTWRCSSSACATW